MTDFRQGTFHDEAMCGDIQECPPMFPEYMFADPDTVVFPFFCFSVGVCLLVCYALSFLWLACCVAELELGLPAVGDDGTADARKHVEAEKPR